MFILCGNGSSDVFTVLMHHPPKYDMHTRTHIPVCFEDLSEKYAHDYTWYVDTILNLIRLAGDYMSEEEEGERDSSSLEDSHSSDCLCDLEDTICHS